MLLMDMDKRPKYFDRWSNLWKFWYEWLADNKLSPLEASIRYMISKPEISRVPSHIFLSKTNIKNKRMFKFLDII